MRPGYRPFSLKVAGLTELVQDERQEYPFDPLLATLSKDARVASPGLSGRVSSFGGGASRTSRYRIRLCYPKVRVIMEDGEVHGRYGEDFRKGAGR